MIQRIHILFIVSMVLTSCATNVVTSDKAEALHRESEWAQHSQDPVPNVFGDQKDKKPVRGGFYEQSGSTTSSSSWEAFAHYTYLAYRNINIGFASYPYSISPSGRLVIIPETYHHGATKHTLKIYDKRRNRFILREVNPLVIRGYKWSKDEQTVQVLFENSALIKVLSIPKTL